MKTKILIGILVSFLVISVVAVTTSIAANDKAKEEPKGPGEKAKAPDLEKIEFIHWKKGFGKPGTECGNDICEPGENSRKCPEDCPKKGDDEPPTTCYAFMGRYGKRYLKWSELPVTYVINPDNLNGLDPEFVRDAISTSAGTWDDATPSGLFNVCTNSDGAAYRVQNYENGISVDEYYSDPDIIGACTVWYNPATKKIVEFDIIFETDYIWGDATNSSTPNVMDLQNIATHELGHGFGLADVYDEGCSDVTMYGYSEEGETKKRTLEEPDVTGIQELYGAP